MPSYDDAIKALKAADAAGNTEDAARLAKIAYGLKSSKPKDAPEKDSAVEFTLGNVFKGVAQVAGLPMEALKNVGNLGKAGYGVAKHELTGSTNLPEPDESYVGDAGWIEDKIRKLGLITKASDPTSTGGRYLAAGIQNLPAALGIPGRAAQLPAKAIAALTSGAGSVLGGDIAGVPGAVIGSMTPTPRALSRALSPENVQERAASERKSEAFKKAQEMGIPVLPSEMKVDKGQVQMEHMVNKDLGQPSGSPITPESMSNYRKGFEDEYANLISSPELAHGIVPTDSFMAKIHQMGDEISALRSTMPGTFKSMKPVHDLLASDFGYGEFPMETLPPKTALRTIRKLRDDATNNLSSDKPGQVELGVAQRKIAVALEDLIEENVMKSKTPQGKLLMQKMRDARTKIAKSYDVEASLDKTTRKLSGAKLSGLKTSGKPLSGNLETLAEVSGEFPKSTAPEGAEEFFTHKVSPWAAEHPKVIAGNVLSRSLNKIKESKPYQAALVDPSHRLTPEQERQLRMQSAIQALTRYGQ
jgi:hypothetical protein